MTNLDSMFKSRDITLPTKVRLVKAMVFFCGHVWMWELDCEESWALKNWCFWTVVLYKTLESPLDCKEIQPVHPKGDQSWIFIGRTDVEAETPILWPPDMNSWLIGRPWCWEGLGAGGEGDDRRWDGRMASPIRWMWVWVNSRCWWWTGRPGMLRFMGSQRVGLDWGTEMNWTELNWEVQSIFPLSCHFFLNNLLFFYEAAIEVQVLTMLSVTLLWMFPRVGGMHMLVNLFFSC